MNIKHLFTTVIVLLTVCKTDITAKELQANTTKQEIIKGNTNNMTAYTIKNVEILNKVSGNMLRGRLLLPNASGKFPIIITAHELGSDCLRPWWVNYGKHWAEEGFAVLSFDFAGGGERSQSDGKTTDMSVLTETEDLEQVLNTVMTWDFIDTSKIILVGGSQGGGVATIISARRQEDIAALILLYPAFHLPDDLKNKYPDINNLPDTDARGGMLTIGKRYITDMYDYDYFKDIAQVKNPVLIVHGENDQTAPLSYSQRAVKVFNNAQLHVIKDSGHVFLTEDKQNEFLQYADEFLKQNNLMAK